METPPVVTKTSTLRMASRRVDSRSPGLGSRVLVDRGRQVGRALLPVSCDTEIDYLKAPAFDGGYYGRSIAISDLSKS